MKTKTCKVCGYTKEDALIHGDHHLCKGTIPGTKKRDNPRNGLVWTKKKPTKPGWYWMRCGCTKAIYDVWIGATGELRYRFGIGNLVESFHGEFAGPIPLPVEK